MNEKMLTKISISGSILCIFTLYILSLNITIEHMEISEIDRSFVGKYVNISGEVMELYVNNGNTFFKLNDGTGKIKVVIWEDTISALQDSDIEIKEGIFINMLGNVEIYKGEIEIIPLRNNVKII